jgi:hypothetical protein
MRHLRILATAGLAGGCASGGGCTPIGDQWFLGAIVALLGVGAFALLGIWWDFRNAQRTNRRDRRDERRADRHDEPQPKR